MKLTGRTRKQAFVGSDNQKFRLACEGKSSFPQAKHVALPQRLARGWDPSFSKTKKDSGQAGMTEKRQPD